MASEDSQRGERRLLLSAGAAYGLVYGTSFALIVWGYDAWLLALNRANLAWAKLLIGLPLTVILTVLVGRLAALSSSASVFVALWAVVGGLLGMIAGRLPFDGGDLAAWLADRRVWGLPVFPYDRAAEVRTTIIAIIGAVVGIAVGFVEYLAVQWAWDRATPKGRLSTQSWFALLVCIPLVLPMAVMVEDQVNQRLRIPQQRAGELVALTMGGADKKEFAAKGQSDSVLRLFREQLSEKYVVHLAASRDIGGYTSAQVDIVFDDGFALRCDTTEVSRFLSVNHRVLHCTDIRTEFGNWVDDLVHAGLTGERRWLESRMRALEVDDATVAWLEAHSDQLTESYEMRREGQQGGWVFLAVQFDSGFEMACRFHGARPVLVDQCVETPSR